MEHSAPYLLNMFYVNAETGQNQSKDLKGKDILQRMLREEDDKTTGKSDEKKRATMALERWLSLTGQQ